MSGKLIKFFGILLVLQTSFATLLFLGTSGKNPKDHAVFGMILGLIILWVFVGGWLMKTFKDSIRTLILKIPLRWGTKFVLFCTFLALVEEAIATAMTNTAPWYGLKIGEAFITVSSNYFQVVLGNSVIIFIPAFIALAILLKRYNFSPNQIFLTFGIMGTCLEVVLAGPQHFLEIGMWMFIYGLMVYLPAYSLPERPNLKPVRFYHFILPFLLYPLCLILFIPVIAGIKLAIPNIDYRFPAFEQQLNQSK